MCLKQDFAELLLDCEKTEKKDSINLKKELDHNLEFVERQKQEVKQVRSVLAAGKSDPATLDKIHIKVQTIQQNIKNFKLKSRAIYEDLH